MNTPTPPGPSHFRAWSNRRAFAPIVARRMLLASYAAALAFTVGCASEPEPTRALETTKYTLENTDRFVLLDKATPITCTGLQETALADGRLEVLANLKNREPRRIAVQASCIFRNEQGIATGEESPWQTVALPENATEAIRFTALNTTAKKYTIRVRQTR